MRLLVLLAILAGLATYALTSWSGIGGGHSSAAECPRDGAPELTAVAPGEVAALRAGLRRVVFFAPGLRPYEEGPAQASFAWSDAEPGHHGSVPSVPRQPGGWEMRWWMPTRDDVVADAFVFGEEEEAREFVRRATATGCRPAGRSRAAPVPRGARDLGWVNPEGFAQEDAYLRRGRRVYRISVVRPGSEGRPTRAERRTGWEIANALACALPGAGCPLRPQGAVSAAA